MYCGVSVITRRSTPMRSVEGQGYRDRERYYTVKRRHVNTILSRSVPCQYQITCQCHLDSCPWIDVRDLRTNGRC